MNGRALGGFHIHDARSFFDVGVKFNIEPNGGRFDVGPKTTTRHQCEKPFNSVEFTLKASGCVLWFTLCSDIVTFGRLTQPFTHTKPSIRLARPGPFPEWAC